MNGSATSPSLKHSRQLVAARARFSNRSSAAALMLFLAELLSEPPYPTTKAGQLISFRRFHTRIQIGCNIGHLCQLVNVEGSAKSRRRGGLFPPALTCAMGECSPSDACPGHESFKDQKPCRLLTGRDLLSQPVTNGSSFRCPNRRAPESLTVIGSPIRAGVPL